MQQARVINRVSQMMLTEKNKNMNNKEQLALLRIQEELDDALSVKVKLHWKEVLKIVVKDLIKKRNSSKGQDRESFDRVLIHYLGDEDFNKYVIKGKKIKP